MSFSRIRTILAAAVAMAMVFALSLSLPAWAQGQFDEDLGEAIGQDIGDIGEEPIDEGAPEDEALDEEPPLDEEMRDAAADLEPGEAEGRWKIKINAAIRANYVFNDSPDSFLIKYSWEIEGQANADTAVIRGDANITAEVEGFLAKWPTGECSLDITIPKVPFEMTFRKSGEDKGSIALKFRRNILENWQSKCTFTDSPGARFETSGDPEKWLARAIERARPPLRSIVTDVGYEETTTSFVINKDIIEDPPIGTVEVEGTGVVTITPGSGGE